MLEKRQGGDNHIGVAHGAAERRPPDQCLRPQTIPLNSFRRCDQLTAVFPVHHIRSVTCSSRTLRRGMYSTCSNLTTCSYMYMGCTYHVEAYGCYKSQSERRIECRNGHEKLREGTMPATSEDHYRAIFLESIDVLTACVKPRAISTYPAGRTQYLITCRC